MNADSKSNADGVGVYIADNNYGAQIHVVNELKSDCKDSWLHITDKTTNDTIVLELSTASRKAKSTTFTLLKILTSVWFTHSKILT